MARVVTHEGIPEGPNFAEEFDKAFAPYANIINQLKSDIMNYKFDSSTCDKEMLQMLGTPYTEAKTANIQTNDPVNHPSHYTDGGIEVIDYIESKNLPFHLGNAVKYISRAGKKDPAKTIEDLEKAMWYIQRYIDVLKKEKER